MAFDTVPTGQTIVAFRGSSKTAGTTTALTGTTVTVAVGDRVFVGFVKDGNTGTVTFAKTGGTCVLGASAELVANDEAAAAGRVHLAVAAVTTAGTLTGITVTHSSIAARGGQAIVIRGLSTNTPTGTLGSQNSTGDLVCGTVSNGAIPAGTLVVGFGGQEGPTTDSGVGDTHTVMDAPTNTGNLLIEGTTGGGATSNQMGTMAFTLAQSALAGGSGTNQAKVLATPRNMAYASAWFSPAGGTNFPQTFTATVGTAATLARAVGALRQAASAISPTRIRDLVRGLAAASPALSAANKATARANSASASTAATAAGVRGAIRSFAASSSAGGLLARTVGAVRSSSSSTSSTSTPRTIAATRTGATPAAASTARAIARNLAGATGALAIHIGSRTYFRAFAATSAINAAAARNTAPVRAGATPTNSTTTRSSSRTFTASSLAAGAIARAVARAYAAATPTSSSARRATSTAKTATSSSSATVGPRTVTRALTAGAGAGASVRKAIARTLAGSSPPAASWVRPGPTITVAATAGTAAAIARAVGARRTASTPTTSSASRIVIRGFATGAAAIALRAIALGRSRIATSSSSASTSRASARPFTAPAAAAASSSRAITIARRAGTAAAALLEYVGQLPPSGIPGRIIRGIIGHVTGTGPGHVGRGGPGHVDPTSPGDSNLTDPGGT